MGLSKVGYSSSDIPALWVIFSRKFFANLNSSVEGTLPQRRVLNLAPNFNPELDEARDNLSGIFEQALEY